MAVTLSVTRNPQRSQLVQDVPKGHEKLMANRQERSPFSPVRLIWAVRKR